MREISRLIYDSISKPFISFCNLLSITPNQLTIFNHIITLFIACPFFAQGTHIGFLVGLAVCLINGFLDYADGDLAKETGKSSRLGIWLDCGFDVIIQNAVMASIGLGCYKMGLDIVWVLLFMVGNAANNFVSFNYNLKFGFDSDKGNNLFRELMGRKSHLVNSLLKYMIDPTINFLSLSFYTYRYWVFLGSVFNVMPLLFICITLINNIRWFIMFALYAVYLHGEDRLFILKVLSALDDEKEDFYRLRHS